MVGPEPLDIRALLADHDAGAGGVDGDAGLLGRALDDDAPDARLAQPLEQESPDLQILVQQLGIFVIGVPARIPGTVDAEAQPDGIDLLTHQAPSARSRTTMVRWLNGFLMRPTRPRALGRQRFITRPLPTVASATTSWSTSSS